MAGVNADDGDWERVEAEDGTAFRRKRLGEAAGGDRLGCSLYELPPGGRSWPYHYHTGNEEALYVLEGTGRVRLDGESAPIEAGDYVAFPSGEGGAHRVVNDAGGTLRYLMLSTMDDPDVTVYPDSEKFGVFVGAPPGGRGERDLSGFYRVDDDVDYWAGEREE